MSDDMGMVASRFGEDSYILLDQLEAQLAIRTAEDFWRWHRDLTEQWRSEIEVLQHQLKLSREMLDGANGTIHLAVELKLKAQAELDEANETIQHLQRCKSFLEDFIRKVVPVEIRNLKIEEKP